MSYNKYRYPDQPRNGSWYKQEYADKCALAEKLGDVGLRQWCVEKIGMRITGDEALDFSRVDALFTYIKGGERNAE